MPRIDHYAQFCQFVESPECPSGATAAEALQLYNNQRLSRARTQRRAAAQAASAARWHPSGPQRISRGAPTHNAKLHILQDQQDRPDSDIGDTEGPQRISRGAPTDHHKKEMPLEAQSLQPVNGDIDTASPEGPQRINDIDDGALKSEAMKCDTVCAGEQDPAPTTPPYSPPSPPAPPQPEPRSLFDGIPTQEPEPQLPKPRGVPSPLNAAEERIFRLFWKDYPRKTHKHTAKLAFHRALTKVHWEVIRVGLAKALPIWEEYEPQFIPEAATWLNQHRWEEVPLPRVPDDKPMEVYHVDSYEDFDKIDYPVREDPEPSPSKPPVNEPTVDDAFTQAIAAAKAI